MKPNTIITTRQLVEGFVMLLSFPLYVMIFRKTLKRSGLNENSSSVLIRYVTRIIQYGIPSTMTWFTRKIVINQYDNYVKYIV